MAAEWTAKDAGTLVRTVVMSAIWITYFLRSERVQRTFVRRLVPAPAGDAQSALAPPA